MYKFSLSGSQIVFGSLKLKCSQVELGKRFETVSGVIHAEPNHILGDGNDITANREPDYIK
jgi:hypothetical protein